MDPGDFDPALMPVFVCIVLRDAFETVSPRFCDVAK